MPPVENTETVVNPSQSTQQGELERNSSFLGYRPGIEATVEEPQPGQETQTEEVVLDENAPETTDAEPTEVEQEDENWLPDEQSKVFPDDVVAKYAKRYGYTAEDLAADPRITKALHDKINSDIFIAQQKAAQTTEEPTLEDETETEPEATQPPLEPTEARKQYYAQVDKFIDSYVDKQAITEAGTELLKAMGVDVASQQPEVQALVRNAPVIGRTLARFGADLVNTMLPRMLPNMLPELVENRYPSFGSMYEKSLYNLAWENVRTDPQYAALPNYGTKEFQQAARQAAAKYPGFEQMVFTDQRTGAPLPTAQQAAMKYAILAKEMAGQRVDPAVVTQAVETGKKLERSTDQKRKAGAVLGAGQSKGKLATGGDDVNASMIAAYNARNGSAFGVK